MAKFLEEMRRRIIAKGKVYWIVATFCGIGGILASVYATEYLPGLMLTPKFFMYRIFSGPRQGQSLESTAVLISDQEFAKNFSGRLPLKRDVMGQMVTALCAAGARVVALDVSLKSDTGTSVSSSSDPYNAETEKFRHYVSDALAAPDATHPWRNPLCRIVLAVALDCDNPPCQRVTQAINAVDFQSERVTEGAANLADSDIRKMPTHRPLADGSDELSLSLAAARAYEASVGINTSLEAGDEFPFITFLTETNFREQKRLVFAADVLASNCDTVSGKNSLNCLNISSIVQGKIVLVGGSWHDVGNALHDGYDTPAQSLPGVLVHLNFVAAYLDKRLTYRLPHGIGILLEGVTVVVLALLAACTEGVIANLVFLLLGGFFLFVCEYILWVSFGLYFDAILPMVFLLLHSHIHDHFMLRYREKGRER